MSKSKSLNRRASKKAGQRAEEYRTQENHPRRPSASELCLCLIVFAAPLVWSQLYFEHSNDPRLLTPLLRLTPLHLAMWILAIAFSFSKKQHSKSYPANTHFPERALLIFLLLSVASLFDSIYLRAGLVELLRLFDFALIFLLARWIAQDQNAATRLTAAFVVGAVATSVWGIREYILTVSQGNTSTWRVFSTFYNPNLLASYLALAFFPALGLALGKPKSLRLLPWLPVPLILICLVLTGSKGGLLAFGIGAIVFTLIAWSSSTKRKQPRMGHFALIVAGYLLAGIAIVMLVPPLRERFVTVLSTQKHSWMFRLLLWESTWRIGMAYPFNGSGLGTFELIYPKFASVGFTRTAHQSYLQIASESGWLTLMALLAFIGSVIRQAISRVHHAITDSRTRWLISGAIAGAVTFIAQNLVDYSWYLPATLFGFALVLGLAMGCGDSETEPPNALGTHPLLARKLAIGSIGTLSIVYTLIVHASQTNALAAYMAPPIAAQANWRKAVTQEPWSAAYRIGLARTLEAYSLFNTQSNNKLKQALGQCEAAIRLQPTRAGNHKTLGDLKADLDNWEGASVAYNNALLWNRYYTDAMIALARAYEIQGKLESAHHLYKRLATLQDSNYEYYKPIELIDLNYAHARLGLGKAILRRGNQKEREAVIEFNKAIKIASQFLQSPAASNQLRDNQADRNRLRAEKLLAQGHAWLSVTLEQSANATKAKAARQRALELDGTVDFDSIRKYLLKDWMSP